MKNVIIASFVFTTLIGCTSNPGTENKNEAIASENTVQMTEAQLKIAGIAVGKMENKTISSVLNLTGKVDVEPGNIVSISSPLGGYLRYAKLIPGMKVSRGQIIAEMEDEQFIQLQQDYLTAKANLVFIEGEYTRQLELNRSKATSDKVYQQAQANYTSQKVLVKSLSEKLKLININPDNLDENSISRIAKIYSPIDGFVSAVNVNTGKFVNPSDVLFEIVNPSDVHLVLNVFEKDINRLSPGQKVIAYSNANPEEKYPAEIYLVGRELSEERFIEIHCHFQKKAKNLVPGMFMNGEIEVQSASAWVLPSDAVVSFENKQFVFIAKANNEFEMVEVKTGNTENGLVEIIIDQNFIADNFVTKGAYSLLMKMKNTPDE
ncbi:MAG: efflux RND transporter periplasmic adaptor subunit [Bacteroidota bacterium]